MASAEPPLQMEPPNDSPIPKEPGTSDKSPAPQESNSPVDGPALESGELAEDLAVDAPSASKKRKLLTPPAETKEQSDRIHEQEFEESDEDGRKAQAAYKAMAKNYYAASQLGVEITDFAEIEFLQAREDEIRRRARVQHLREHGWSPAEGEQMQVEEADDDEPEVTETPAPKKKRTNRIENEANAMALDGLLEMDARERKKQVTRNRRAAKEGESGGRKPGRPKSAKSTPGKWNMNTALGGGGAHSLLRQTNFFASDREVRDEGEDDTHYDVTSKNKQHALKEILESLAPKDKQLAQLDMNGVRKASEKFRGTGLVKISKEGWMVNGLVTGLKHFQMVGASWMVERETSVTNLQTGTRAGFLADEMGLGKTLQTLALIMNDIAAAQKEKKPKRVGPTLIICPSSLVTNWENEIERHCDLGILDREGPVLRFTSKTEKINSRPQALLQGAAIVITTPSEIQRSCKKITFPLNLQTMAEKEDWLKKHRQEFRGPMFQVQWNRVIIDEATVIKNHLSLTSLAARELMTKSRFALSGTPLMNTANTELYSYFKFLRIPKTGDYRTFSHNYNIDSKTGRDRMTAMLGKYMLRRTYDDKLLGLKLVVLPAATKITHNAQMDEVEKLLYSVVKNRLSEQIESLEQEGQLTISHILVRILRLRQCAAHILLILDLIKDVLNADDIAELEKAADSMSSTAGERAREESLRDLRRVLKHWQDTDHAEDGRRGQSSETEELEELSGLAYTASSHGLSYNFYKYLDSLRSSAQAGGDIDMAMQCGYCQNPVPENAVVTSCRHVFCESCLEDVSLQAAVSGHCQAKCPVCNTVFTFNEPLADRTSIPELGEDDGSLDGRGSGKKKKQKHASLMKWILKDQQEPLPSAKTTVAMHQIANWISEEPSVKVILFSQFVGFLYIMSRILKAKGIKNVLFEGSMSIEERQKAMDTFSSWKGPCIFLSSLRCGGMGLNLTVANKVINTDPYWNEALEDQAFARVYRIGQERKTCFVRIFLKGSYDEKIRTMQERKAVIIQDIMEVKDKLDMDELRRLFQEDGEEYVLGVDRPVEETILEDDAYLKWDK